MLFEKILHAVKFLAIKKALARPSPNSIPLSGWDRLVKRDYFTLYAGDKAAYLRSLTHLGAEGFWYDDYFTKSLPVSIPIQNLLKMNFYVTQYFRHLEFKFSSPTLFLIFQAVSFHRLLYFYDRTCQFLFNRKSLVREDRLSLLKILIKCTLDDENFALSSISVMSTLHGTRWPEHPDNKRAQIRYRLLLESLEDSGDLKMEDGSFRITGRAFTTLYNYEVEERRHRNSVITQWTLAFLTLALVIFGGLQLFK